MTSDAAPSKAYFGMTCAGILLTYGYMIQDKPQMSSHQPSASRGSLPAEAVLLLGSVSDRELSRRFEISPYTCKLERLARGISAYSHKRELPSEAINVLGKVKDIEIAARYSIPLSTIHRHRVGCGMPRFKLHEWSAEEITLLGRSSDKEVAKKVGVSYHVVRYKRKQLGVKAYSPKRSRNIEVAPTGTSGHLGNKTQITAQGLRVVSDAVWHEWSAEEIALLGKYTDVEVAKQIGVSYHVVTYKRKQLGVTAAKRYIKWDADLLELLGTVPDCEVAKRANGRIKIAGVRKKRYERGISLCPAPKPASKGGRAAQCEVVALLGTISDYKLAEQTGIDRASITKQRLRLGIKAACKVGRLARIWTAEEDALLGVESDLVIAHKLKISPSAVGKRRSLLVIGVAGRVNSWSSDEDAMLGTMVDSQLAHRLKVSISAVFNRRKALGIQAYRFAYS